MKRVRDMAGDRVRQVDDFLERRCEELFRDTPFQNTKDFAAALIKLLDDKDYRNIYDLR